MASISPHRLARHWTANFDRVDIDGRRVSKRKTICGVGCAERRHRGFPTARSATEARRVADRLEGEFRDEFGDGAAIPLAAVIDRWLETGRHEQFTRRGYERIVRRHVGPALGRRFISDITARDIASYRDRALESGLSPATVNQHLALINGALRYGVEQGWLVGHPGRDVRRATQGAPKGDVPAEADIVAVLAHLTAGAMSQRVTAVALSLACSIGARRGELAVRRWDDIDWSAQTLTIDTAADIDGAPKKTKTRQGRVVPLTDPVIASLLAWREIVGDSPWILPSPGDIDRHIPADTIGQAILRVVRAHADRTGPCDVCGLVTIGRVWMHGGRHYAASRMIQAGVDAATAAEVLGHSTPTLMRVYAHGRDDTRRAAVAAIPPPGTGI